MSRPRLATLWLDGCSGCHMSLLDLDERLLELATKADIVFSPLVDVKEFPRDVDIALVEGAIGTDEDREKILKVRERSRLLVAFGDCAVTGNVPAMRNPHGTCCVLARAYHETVTESPQTPAEKLPRLAERVCPIHEVVAVDLVIPGCPPPADVIHEVLTELVAGRMPDPARLSRFGQ